MRLILLFLCFGLVKLNGTLVSNPPHTRYISSVTGYEHVMSANTAYRQQILDRLSHFSWSNYNIYKVHNLGLFLLDQKADWIKDCLKNNQTWEGYLAPLIQQYVKPNTVVIDAGAHIGTHTLNLSRAVGPEGMVIAFEPQPKIFCELFMNTRINKVDNVWCYWSALGDTSGEIHLPNFHPDVEVQYLFDHRYGDSGNIAPMIPLDFLELDNVSFIKVDVDGCDDIFLDGARNTIQRNKPVIVMEILGGADIDTATPEQKQQILNTQNKIIELGYTLERVSIHDYLCLPIIQEAAVPDNDASDHASELHLQNGAL